jgi:hypothetical protein
LSAKNLGYISEGKGKEIESFDISEAPRKELGDITCNIAFKLSKRLKRRPYEIAIELVEKELNPLIQEHQKKLCSPCHLYSEGNNYKSELWFLRYRKWQACHN